KREQTVQTDCRKDKADYTEAGDKNKDEPLSRARLRGGIFERNKIVRSEINIRTGKRGADRRLVNRAAVGVQNKGYVVERCRRVHEHLREWPRNHAEHFAVARIGNRFHITDDADNREPRASSIESSPADAFPDRRIVRPKAFRDALADNADQRCVGSVARVEIAALKNRLADALEIPGQGQARVR